jgi:hypothetical protein
MNGSSCVALNFNLDMSLETLLGIGIHSASRDVIQIVFAAVLADFGGNIANDHD